MLFQTLKDVRVHIRVRICKLHCPDIRLFLISIVVRDAFADVRMIVRIYHVTGECDQKQDGQENFLKRIPAR